MLLHSRLQTTPPRIPDEPELHRSDLVCSVYGTSFPANSERLAHLSLVVNAFRARANTSNDPGGFS